jgi:hypothetical protein
MHELRRNLIVAMSDAAEALGGAAAEFGEDSLAHDLLLSHRDSISYSIVQWTAAEGERLRPNDGAVVGRISDLTAAMRRALNQPRDVPRILEISTAIVSSLPGDPISSLPADEAPNPVGDEEPIAAAPAIETIEDESLPGDPLSGLPKD